MAYTRQRRTLSEVIQDMTETPNELGLSMCELADGMVVPGTVAEGTPTGVQIPLECPHGSRWVGMMHSHPGGVAYPSSTDIKSARATGAEHICIVQPQNGEVQCFEIARP